MIKILGIFRGFPGLGRIVSGVSLMETLRDKYGCSVKMISYLQGQVYLEAKGYKDVYEVTPKDYCSLGLLPTNHFGAKIHKIIKEFRPSLVIIDGEPLMLQSIKISYPNLKTVVLLNPSDVINKYNDIEAMNYFRALYSLSDLAIIHGLKTIQTKDYKGSQQISINTILRKEIFNIKRRPTNNVYCVLGGGTVNVDTEFKETTLKIARLCIDLAKMMNEYKMNIICSSENIYNEIKSYSGNNIEVYSGIIDPTIYYSKACLIITRSGRNTLSELAYLGIPTIAFTSGDHYRINEQKDNINNLRVANIVQSDINISAKELVGKIKKIIVKEESNHAFIPGNKPALKAILNML